MGMKQKLIMMVEFARLRQNFQKHFSFMPALTPELTTTAYRVRHQVYCKELGWEAERIDGLESDAHDHHSLHCLMQAKTSGEFIGCVRLVRSNPDDPEERLPMEKTCGDKLNRNQLDLLVPDRRELAEISRLGIIAAYRRRPHERDKPAHIDDSDYGKLSRPRFPYIPFGLNMGMLAMAREEGIDNLLLLTEPTLAIHFVRLGAKLTPLGDPIEHRGIRLPFLLKVNATINNFSLIVKPLYRAIADEVHAGYVARDQGRIMQTRVA